MACILYFILSYITLKIEAYSLLADICDAGQYLLRQQSTSSVGGSSNGQLQKAANVAEGRGGETGACVFQHANRRMGVRLHGLHGGDDSTTCITSLFT